MQINPLQSKRNALFFFGMVLNLLVFPCRSDAVPLGPDPLEQFEGNIGYQANAESLLRCETPVCDNGLGFGSTNYSCTSQSSSQLTLQNVPEDLPNFRLVYADLSWAASEGAQAALDADVTLTTPNGTSFDVSADEERSEAFTDGLANCQQLIPLICAEAPANLSCDLQFFAYHALLTDALNQYLIEGGSLNGEWLLSNISISGSEISDPQTAIAAIGSLTIGAWSLLLIYEAPDLPSRKIYYYQGLELNEGVNRQLFPSGFTAPPNPTVDLTLMALEGDQQISGDQLKLNGRQIADQCNPANNVFNSTVNVNGSCRQGVTGVDLDRFEISGAVEQGDTEAELELVIPTGNGITTAGEQLFTHWLVLAFDHLLPTFDQLKPEKRASPPHQEPVALGQVITYEISIQNIGEAAATNVLIRDPTPENTTYVTGSAQVDQLPINDGPQQSNPFAAGVQLTDLPQVGDQIEINEGHLVRFQVRVNDEVSEGVDIANIAQISADLIDPTSTNLVIHPVDLSLNPSMSGEEAGDMAGMSAGVMAGMEQIGGDIAGEAAGEMVGGSLEGGLSGGADGTGGIDEDRSGEMTESESGNTDRPSSDFCGEGTRYRESTQLCESICGPGLRWDATCEPSRCVQESQPPCQMQESSRASDGGCQSLTQTLPTFWSICFLITLLRIRRHRG